MNEHRHTIPTTCKLHGAKGFCNLAIARTRGDITLDPHVTGACVIVLDETAATQLRDVLTAQPPTALVPAGEPLPQLHRPLAPPPAPVPTPVTTPVVEPTRAPEPIRVPEPVAAPAVTPAPPEPAPAAAPAPEPAAPPAPDLDPLAAELEALIRRTGKTPGRRTVARELGISEHTARKVIDLVTAGTPALNGQGGAQQ